MQNKVRNYWGIVFLTILWFKSIILESKWWKMSQIYDRVEIRSKRVKSTQLEVEDDWKMICHFVVWKKIHVVWCWVGFCRLKWHDVCNFVQNGRLPWDLLKLFKKNDMSFSLVWRCWLVWKTTCCFFLTLMKNDMSFQGPKNSKKKKIQEI